MAERKIIHIDEKKCNGCGLCIPDCPEGALQIIDGKARLVSDLFCDGLGACIGSCPRGAIKIVEREAEPYNEKKVMGKIVKQGNSVIKAHLEHLKEHGENRYLAEAISFLNKKKIKNPLNEKISDNSESNQLPCGCPGSKVIDTRNKAGKDTNSSTRQESELRQWPIQLSLVPEQASYFDEVDLLIAADCVPFAYANFHQDFLRNKTLIIGCPKLDDINFYKDKLIQIFQMNNIKTVSIAHMEVPCCFELRQAVEEAIKDSGRKIPIETDIITIRGGKK